MGIQADIRYNYRLSWKEKVVPNYEYKCVSCEHIFELWQNVGEAAPQCPECGSEVKKVFHPPRVIFKGSGFYVTDLRAEKEGKSGKSSSAGESSAPSAPAKEASTESKPEPAPAAASSDKPAASPAPTATADKK